MKILLQDKRNYDRPAKDLLSRKNLIAPILQRVLPGYQNLTLKEIEERLPGKGERIDFDYVENLDSTLKPTILDLVFFMRKSVYKNYPGTIINIEIQNDIESKHILMERACAYLARIEAEQKERYGELNNIFSVWILFDETRIGETQFYNFSPSLTGRKIERKQDGRIYLTPPEQVNEILYEEVAKDSNYASPLNLILIRVGRGSKPNPGTVEAYIQDLFFKNFKSREGRFETFKNYGVELNQEEIKLFKEGTPLADIMIEYGESIGEKRGEKRGEAIGEERGIKKGKAEMLQDIQETYKKAIKENPEITFPEFMEEFLKNQNDD